MTTDDRMSSPDSSLDSSATSNTMPSPEALAATIAELELKRDRIQTEIAESQEYLARFVQDSVANLERRQQTLQRSVEQLERRQARIQSEMKETFSGSSQEIAIRVQSFKDYLVGSLEDLVLAAQKLELTPPESLPGDVSGNAPGNSSGNVLGNASGNPTIAADASLEEPQFTKTVYEQQTEKIRSVIRMFRTEPDYYGPTWKLRRTFESVHADRMNDWFFTQGGRGSLKSLGSRLQNILVSSAAISILYNLYGDKLRPLVLANSPERLGEWRRGLQDCLGLRRDDFSNERGVMLFESPDPMAARAERLQNEGKMPFIIIDETEELVSLTLLRFPLWLAFAPEPQKPTAQPLVQPRLY